MGLYRQRRLLGSRLDPVWSNRGETVGVVAPPGYGKTVGLVAGAVAAFEAAVVQVTTKDDVFRLTGRGRAELGPIWVLDLDGRLPPGAEGREARFNLIGGWQDFTVASERAGAIIPRGEDEKTGFFTDSAATLLACLGHAAALGGQKLPELLHWIASRRFDAALEILEAEPGEGGLIGPVLRRISKSRLEDTVESFWVTIDRALSGLYDPRVRRSFEAATLDPEELIRQKGTLYVIDRKGGGTELSPRARLVSAVLDEVIQVAYRLGEALGEQARYHPVLLASLDEIATCAPLPNFGSLLSQGSGRGVATMWATQNFGQLDERWGPNLARAILDATNNIVVFGGLGLGGMEVLERISRSAGKYWEQESSWSTNGRGERSESTRTVERALLPADEIVRQPHFHAHIVNAGRVVPIETLPLGEVRELAPLLGSG